MDTGLIYALLFGGSGDIEGLPTVTADDNGKMLQVVNGAWSVVTITNGNEVAY